MSGRCTMGVGCDEYGICYAEAHGQPEQCPHYVPPHPAPFFRGLAWGLSLSAVLWASFALAAWALFWPAGR